MLKRTLFLALAAAATLAFAASARAAYLDLGVSNPSDVTTTLVGNSAGPELVVQNNNPASATSAGLFGVLTAPAPTSSGAAIRGANNSTNGFGYGVWGSHAGGGTGVLGSAVTGRGVSGTATIGTGVRGVHTGTKGTAPGVSASTSSTDSSADALLATVTSTSPGGASAAVRGVNNGTGSLGVGVWGSQAGSGWGGYFTAHSGIGVNASTDSGTGVNASTNAGNGVNASTQSGFGVFAQAQNGTGVYGQSSNGSGILGQSGSSSKFSAGVYGTSATTFGVQGVSSGSAAGIAGLGGTGDGIYGQSAYADGVDGVNTSSGNGVYGQATTGTGVAGLSDSGYGIYANSTSSYAAWLAGKVIVTGGCTGCAGASLLQIDDPLDPAHKYLQHSSVASSQQLDIYSGNVTTDAKGFATVTMPSWFQALNRSFRYQLTPIGRRAWGAQAIVWDPMKGNRFTIRSKPAVEISWQVTAVRHDRYANAHPVQVIAPKAKADRGKYLHPELYGKPRSDGIGFQKPPRLLGRSMQKR